MGVYLIFDLMWILSIVAVLGSLVLIFWPKEEDPS